MALLQVQFDGNAIGKQSSMLVLIPPGKGPFPVLYLLHGLSDDHTIWLRRTSLERYLGGRDLIVVMPDGHRSFYVDDPRPGGLAYEKHITQDVVGFCDRVFPTIAKRKARALAGLSMGGYGAVMLALKNPDLFGCAVSHSGALAFAHGSPERLPDMEPLVSAIGGKYDCFKLASAVKKAGRRDRPALRFDCGTEDFLLDHNRSFHAHLNKIGYAHDYIEHAGAHSWDYWDEHIQETLPFVMEHVR
jgi:putative tributyrin esterase